MNRPAGRAGCRRRSASRTRGSRASRSPRRPQRARRCGSSRGTRSRRSAGTRRRCRALLCCAGAVRLRLRAYAALVATLTPARRATVAASGRTRPRACRPPRGPTSGAYAHWRRRVEERLHDPPGSSTPSCRVKRRASPTIAAWRSTSYGVAPRRPGPRTPCRARCGRPRRIGPSSRQDGAEAGGRVELDDDLVRLDDASPKPIRGGCLNTTRTRSG